MSGNYVKKSVVILLVKQKISLKFIITIKYIINN